MGLFDTFHNQARNEAKKEAAKEVKAETHNTIAKVSTPDSSEVRAAARQSGAAKPTPLINDKVPTTQTATAPTSASPTTDQITKLIETVKDADKKDTARIAAYKQLPEAEQKKLYENFSADDKKLFLAPTSTTSSKTIDKIKDTDLKPESRGKLFTELKDEERQAFARDYGVTRIVPLLKAYQEVTDKHRHTPNYKEKTKAIEDAYESLKIANDGKSVKPNFFQKTGSNILKWGDKHIVDPVADTVIRKAVD